MNKTITLLIGLFATAVLVACLHTPDTKIGLQSASNTEQPTPFFLALSHSAMEHEVEVEKAAAKRTVAQDRCTGMVGAAKNVCLADADQLYFDLVRVADRRLASTQVAVSTSHQ